jgi:hypothetical protein
MEARTQMSNLIENSPYLRMEKYPQCNSYIEASEIVNQWTLQIIGEYFTNSLARALSLMGRRKR